MAQHIDLVVGGLVRAGNPCVPMSICRQLPRAGFFDTSFDGLHPANPRVRVGVENAYLEGWCFVVGKTTSCGGLWLEFRGAGTSSQLSVLA